MKIPHLPLTDLARIAVLPADEQLHELMQVKRGGGGPNYRPVRSSFADIVNRKPALFTANRTDWETIRHSIAAGSKSEIERLMNQSVARSLNNYCLDNNIEAREVDADPIKFLHGPSIVCWSKAIFIYEKKITIPFVYYRKSNALSGQSIRFMFSMQHEALRVNKPDYYNIDLEIIKFHKDQKRTIYTVNESNMKLFTYIELEEMISFTQNLWVSVCQERTQEKRRAGGGAGSLL